MYQLFILIRIVHGNERISDVRYQLLIVGYRIVPAVETTRPPLLTPLGFNRKPCCDENGLITVSATRSNRGRLGRGDVRAAINARGCTTRAQRDDSRTLVVFDTWLDGFRETALTCRFVGRYLSRVCLTGCMLWPLVFPPCF